MPTIADVDKLIARLPTFADEFSEVEKQILIGALSLYRNHFRHESASDVDPTAGIDPKFNWDGDG